MVKKSVLRFKALINAYPKVSILLTATLFFLYRLLFLPGLEFNSKIWDDEVGWEKEFHQKSFLEWITYRDAPGYFVFLPRLILAICHIAPDLIFASSLRIILIILNLVCVYFASKLVIGRDKGPATALLVFGCFSSIYISDLNYLHNIAYYFIFPILFLVQKISKGETKFSLGYLFLMILFINKPIVAILLLILFLYLFLINGFSKKPLWILVFYNIFYLGSYLFLPNRWPTPTNSDLMTLKQVLLNIPWVTGSVLLPAVYFGLNGFLHFLQLDLLRKILGISLYLIPSISAIFFGARLSRRISLKRGSHRLQISALLLVSSYLLVYVNSDSYWIKAFPLYNLNVPQDLWLRWSSLIPILVLAVLWEIGKLLNAYKLVRIIFGFIMLQQFIFQIAAYSWLKR